MLAFDAKRAFQNTSGLGNYSRTHLLNLRKFLPDESLLLFTPQVKIPFIEENERVHIQSPQGFLRNKLGASYWRSYRIGKEAKSLGASVFHGLSNELPMNILRSSMKKIVTIHDLIYVHYPHYYSPWDRRLYHQKVRYACEAADAIICISQQTLQDLEKIYQVQASKLQVIYQDCSERFHLQASTSEVGRVKHAYSLTKPYVISVGTLEPRKKQASLVKAFSALKNENIELVLIGRKTAYQKELETLISELKLHIKVRILNQVASEDLPALYKGAVFSAYMSEYEGFGLPVIESLNQGVPVLASNRSCLPEAGGEGALYVDPDNIEEIVTGMLTLLQDSELRSNKSVLGLKHVLNFRAENTIGPWKELYLG